MPIGMTLTLIGLGLDPRDLGSRAKTAITSAEHVLLETYTSASPLSLAELEAVVGSTITPLTRSMVEQDDIVLERAKDADTALLVFGDPLAATTHAELLIRAKAAGIETRVFHAPSIISAIGEAGLELYRYGRTASLVYPRKNWLPERASRIITENRQRGEHTLVLLDIVTGEEEFSLLDRDHTAFAELDRSLVKNEQRSLADEPQLLMSPNEAIAILLHQETVREDETLIVASRLGTDESQVMSGAASDLLSRSFGLGPHAIVVPGELHFLEEEYVSSIGSR